MHPTGTGLELVTASAAKGSLVATDRGVDLPMYVFASSGMHTKRVTIADRRCGIVGQNRDVFVSYKR